MKTKRNLIQNWLLCAALSTLTTFYVAQPSTAFAQGTAFTYQGRLQNNGSPASGTYDLTFSLFNTNTSGVPISGPITNNAVSVTNGLFTVLIDFGPGAFTGQSNWLEIAVETNGVGSFTTLAPRQQLTPVPYAIYAENASGLSGTLPVSQVSGVVPLIQLPAAVMTNYATSVSLSGFFTGNFGGSFYGNGGGLTGLNPASLSGILADSQLSANITRLNGTNNFTGTNTFAGVTVATNLNNVIAGAFIGNGGGLTNFSTAQFANSVLTNGEAGVTLVGTFTGTGAGLTGLNPANLNAGTAAINISGNATTATTANNFSGSLNGDVTGAQGTTLVSSVGGQTAANVASGASAANAATSANTASTIVKRDGTGNFSAATITANNFSGNGGGLTNVTAAVAATLAIPPGMALVPAGSFTIGNSTGDSDITDAYPTNIFVSGFYMDVNLVSFSQWQSVYFWATNHGYNFVNIGAGKAPNHPVQLVNWYDCLKWCNARSLQAGLAPIYYTDAGLTQVYTNGETTNVFANWTVNGYRLPTEAEYEKAERGGLSGQRFPWGNVITENLANYQGQTSFSYDLGPNGNNSAFTNGYVQPFTSPGGYFAPNGYGLYDMAGNVGSWCWDWYGTPYAGGADPRGPASNPNGFRVARGSSFSTLANWTRCAARNYTGSSSLAINSIGLRCVRAH